ncbi:MAG: hypothetical protein ACI4XM_02110 [Candidatus Coprovivens sp.]
MTLGNLDIQLANNPLNYRDILTIPTKTNIGLELELENVDIRIVHQDVITALGHNWITKVDDSLLKGKSAEIVTPVFQNRKQTWILLKKLGEILERLKPTYDNCSFQVNFDGKLLPKLEDRVRFIKLYAMYEDIIYRFSQGEDNKYRDSLEIYASPIILALKGCQGYSKDTIVDYFSNNKRYGLVFKTNGKDLIEFRTPNATSNSILWQNYITTFYYLIKFATSNKYPKKEIDEYIDKFMSIYLLERYSVPRLEKALKLSNMIFPHKQDQLYFMHQYIGKSK